GARGVGGVRAAAADRPRVGAAGAGARAKQTVTDTHKRRPRYPGTHPRTFQQKYKELDPERYASEVQKVVDAGKTPAGMHLPILVSEVLEHARPSPGEIVVDCTLG